MKTSKIFDKIKFFCSGAAANVSSEGNGVAGLMAKDIPGLKSHKCLCHLQNTALKHTYQKYEMLQMFNKDLCELINFINFSPKKLKILEDKEKELEFETSYQLIRGKEVRWNSFAYATSRVRLLYAAIHDVTEEYVKIAKTKHEERVTLNIKNQYIQDFNFVFLLHWLSDFLQPICSLNKQLQRENYELAHLQDEVDVVINILETDYINLNKPPLNNTQNMHETKTLDEIMKYHLGFGGFYLNELLSNCTFVVRRLSNISITRKKKEYCK